MSSVEQIIQAAVQSVIGQKIRSASPPEANGRPRRLSLGDGTTLLIGVSELIALGAPIRSGRINVIAVAIDCWRLQVFEIADLTVN